MSPPDPPAEDAAAPALLLDLGEVLVRVRPKLAVNAFAARLGAPGSRVEQALFGGGLKTDHDLGRISAGEFRRGVLQRLGAGDLPDAEFDRLWSSLLLPNPGMDDLLERLLSRYRVFLLSNTDPIHYPAGVRLCPPIARMHGRHLSYESGLLKPDIRYFETALERFGLAPGACRFFDDRAENVQAARAAGIPSWQVDGGALTPGLLARAGVDVK
ncbi:MAG: Alpha-D-glucose 1-phosphate phosphatase YihX [Myxococcota bacterium]|nr:Alpha-D-glucose 1-phosphate phosphatase YihX [Myxococcota bacterium]